MKKLAFLLLIASSSFAQQHSYSEIYPSDFKPAECASKEKCESFTDVSFIQAAHAFLLRTLDTKFDNQYSDEFETTAQKFCVKRATCNASPGRVWWFCNDVFAQELRATCDTRFTPNSDDWGQCRTWMDTYSAGVDQRGSKDWVLAQECLKKTTPQPGLRQMDWWSVPETIPVGYTGNVRIFAVDRETHVPVQADIRFEDQIIYATDPPVGQPVTYYVFKWPRKLNRVTRADGSIRALRPACTPAVPSAAAKASEVRQ